MKTKLAGWITIKDLSTIIENCEKFNQGRTYEIFGEYCNLTPNILKERGTRYWFYYENEKLRGFALGRHKRGILLRMGDNFIFEEVWGPCDGLSNELSQPSERDIERILKFKKLLNSTKWRSPIVLRAATDNQFAHMIARALGAKWINGLIIAERTLNKKVKFSNPKGYKLRMFEDGDQFCMSKIHEEAFKERCKPKIYKAWATAANCRTIIATHREKPIGFIIAEKRRCNSLGDFNIAVKPHYHNKGVGSALLKAAFNVFIDMNVQRVIADYLMLNAPAHRLYQKHGFKPKRIYNYFLIRQKNLTI
jgi:ribosomal protein S18 acetylase RimI-like enzyme